MSPEVTEGTETAADTFEQAAARVAVVGRAIAAATTIVNTLTARATFRRPAVMYATAAAVATHAVSSSARSLRRGQVLDRSAAKRDLVAGILALVGEAFARGNLFRYGGSRPGTDYAPIAAALIAAELAAPGDRRRAHALLCGAVAATTIGGQPDGAGLATTQLLVDLAGPTFSATTASWMSELLRETARQVAHVRELDVAEQIEARRRLAQARQHRLLHDSVLQVFEAIAADLAIDDDATIRWLERETQRLVDTLGGQTLTSMSGVLDRLQSFGEALQLDILISATGSLDATSRDLAALADAGCEAIMNVHKHSESRHVQIDAAIDGQGYELIITDFGKGFALASGETSGFGIANSIQARVAEVNGRAEIDSATGRGTRVRLWIPT